MRTHRSIRILVMVAAIVGGSAVTALVADASPISGQATAGECTGVELELYTPTSQPTRIRANAGSCVEADPNAISFVQTGTLFINAPTLSCSAGATHVEANVTFWPTSNFYSNVRVTLDDIPFSGLTAVTLRDTQLPPAFVGGGLIQKTESQSCTSAIWSDGVIVYEDPVVSTP